MKIELSDLNVGNVIELRNGDRLVFKGKSEVNSFYRFNKGIAEFTYGSTIQNFNDKLKHLNNENYDIMKIYKDMAIYFDEDIKPIWKRSMIEDVTKGELVWCKTANNEYVLKSFVEYDYDDNNFIVEKIKLSEDGKRKSSGITYSFKEINKFKISDLGGSLYEVK